MRILVLGSGLMGPAAAFNAMSDPDVSEVVLCDFDPRQLNAARAKLRRTEGAGKYRIRVNTISPGATRTPEFEEMITALANGRGMTAEDMWRTLKAANSLNRIAEPEEIARAVVFMASDHSSAMTGHNMIVSCSFHLIHPQELHRV